MRELHHSIYASLLLKLIGIDVSGNPAKGADAQDAIVNCLEKVKAGGRFKGVLELLF